MRRAERENVMLKPSGTRSRRAVLLTSDLIFSSMVTGTARALGLEISVVADVEKAGELCCGEPLGCIFIDLGFPGLDINSAVSRLRIAAGSVPTVAYGAHVNKARLDQARIAGCDKVLPRSKFSAELPDLLRRYLGAPELA